MRIAYPKTVFFILLMVLGGLVWWLDETSSPDFTTHKLSADRPDLIAYHVVGVHFDAFGKPVGKLSSPELRHYQVNNVSWLISPVLEQFSPNKPQLTISSQRAKLLQDTDEIIMYEQVQLIRAASNDKPMITMNTSNVTIDIDKETARSQAAMSAVAGSHHVDAVGFDFDHKNEILNLHKQVKVMYGKEK